MSRTIAIGDIHGCSIALSALLQAIDPQPDDNIVTIGDYIDRGPTVEAYWSNCGPWKSVADLCRFTGTTKRCFSTSFRDHAGYEFWMDCGGMVTLESYDPSGSLSMIPEEHIDFVKRLKLYHETGTHSSPTPTTIRACLWIDSTENSRLAYTRSCSRSSLLRQDGHCGAYSTNEPPDSQPRMSEVHSYCLRRAWFADWPGC